MTAATAATANIILHHVTAFLDEAVAKPELRHRILTLARLRLSSTTDPVTVQSLTLISETLNASAVRAAEKIVLSLPSPNPLSALLVALIHSILRRPIPAAIALLDVFAIDPAAARYDIAPSVFEHLFVPHLIPVHRWFAYQRARVLSRSLEEEEEEESEGLSIEVAASMSSLSRMSGDQTVELKGLERGYEEVLNANSRVYAEYLKGVLESSDGMREAPSVPQLVLMRIDGGDAGFEKEEEEEEEVEEEVEVKEKIGLRSGRRYNV